MLELHLALPFSRVSTISVFSIHPLCCRRTLGQAFIAKRYHFQDFCTCRVILSRGISFPIKVPFKERTRLSGCIPAQLRHQRTASRSGSTYLHLGLWHCQPFCRARRRVEHCLVFEFLGRLKKMPAPPVFRTPRIVCGASASRFSLPVSFLVCLISPCFAEGAPCDLQCTERLTLLSALAREVVVIFPYNPHH